MTRIRRIEDRLLKEEREGETSLTVTPTETFRTDTKKGKLRFVRNCFPHHGYVSSKAEWILGRDGWRGS